MMGTVNEDKLDADVCPVCGHRENPRWAKIVGTVVIAIGLVIVGLGAAWLIHLLWGAL